MTPPIEIEDPLAEFQKSESFNEAANKWKTYMKSMGFTFASDEAASREYLNSPASETWRIGMELGKATKELVAIIKENVNELNNPESTTEKGELMKETKSLIKQIFSAPDALASAAGMHPKEFKKEFGLDDLPNANEAEHKFLVNQVLTKYGPKSSSKSS